MGDERLFDENTAEEVGSAGQHGRQPHPRISLLFGGKDPTFGKRFEERMARGREATITDVKVTEEQLIVFLDDGREIRTPLAWYPRLLNASPEERRRWELLSGGVAVSWPGLDEDLSLRGMLAGVPAPGFRLG